MNNSVYERLSLLVANNQLQFIHVVGLPRSNGTAVHLALTQAQEVIGQLNEPFYYPDMKGRKWDYMPPVNEAPPRTFEEGCQYILEKYEKEVLLNEKVVLIIHDLSQDLTSNEYVQLRKLNSHDVFVIREPTQNALSLLTRYTNDTLSQPGGNLLSSQDVLQLMLNEEDFIDYFDTHFYQFSYPSIRELIGKGKGEPLSDKDLWLARQKVMDVWKEEFTSAWDNEYHFFQIAKEDPNGCPFTVFDGNWLFDKPEDHLRHLVERINVLTYTSDMIDNWTKGNKDNFDCIITRKWDRSLAQNNAWNGSVRNSSGIVKHKDSISEEISLNKFPIEIRSIIQKRGDLYRRMLSE